MSSTETATVPDSLGKRISSRIRGGWSYNCPVPTSYQIHSRGRSYKRRQTLLAGKIMATSRKEW